MTFRSILTGETKGISQLGCRPTCTLPMSWLPALEPISEPWPAEPLSKATGWPCRSWGVPGWEPVLEPLPMGLPGWEPVLDMPPSEPLSKVTGWPRTDAGAAWWHNRHQRSLLCVAVQHSALL